MPSPETPLYDGTVAEIAVAHTRSEPSRVAEVNGKSSVPRALEAVVMRALSREPGRRPATAKQLANSLLAAPWVRSPKRLTRRWVISLRSAWRLR